jgi:hypothetical protein
MQTKFILLFLSALLFQVLTHGQTFDQRDASTALTATADFNGTGLLWNTTQTGGTASAPLPSTTTLGNTSYWVSSTNAGGFESERMEPAVAVTAILPATQLNFDGVNDGINLGSDLTTHFVNKSAITLEAFVHPETNSGTGVIVGNYNFGTTDGMQVLLRIGVTLSRKLHHNRQ